MRIPNCIDIVEFFTKRKYDAIISLQYELEDHHNYYTHFGYWDNNGKIYCFQDNISNDYYRLKKALEDIENYQKTCDENLKIIYGYMRSFVKNIGTGSIEKYEWESPEGKIKLKNEKWITGWRTASFKSKCAKYNLNAQNTIKKILLDEIQRRVAKNHDIEIVL